ncbi:NadR/Ttd14, AAA domain conataining protein [Candidatus Hepatincola sp. Av]
MCKFIAFSGSHGVGKTTLINKIAERLDSKIKIFNEINTGLARIGFPLNANGHDFHETMFAQKQAFDLSYNTILFYLSRQYEERIIVSDRSCLDTYIYTSYFLSKYPEHQEEYGSLLADMAEKSKEIVEKVTHVFLPPFYDFEETNMRMTIEDRNAIWQKFLEYLAENSSPKSLILEGANTTLRLEEFVKVFAN